MGVDEHDELDREEDADTSEDRLEEHESRLEALESRLRGRERDAATTGYSIGATLAVMLSWHSYHAVIWAALAGIFSWFYVIYYVVRNWGHVKLI
jgi:hypothetical protein